MSEQPAVADELSPAFAYKQALATHVDLPMDGGRDERGLFVEIEVTRNGGIHPAPSPVDGVRLVLTLGPCQATVTGNLPGHIELGAPDQGSGQAELTIKPSPIRELTIDGRGGDQLRVRGLSERIETLRLIGPGQIELADIESVDRLLIDSLSDENLTVTLNRDISSTTTSLRGPLDLRRTTNAAAGLLTDKFDASGSITGDSSFECAIAAKRLISDGFSIGTSKRVQVEGSIDGAVALDGGGLAFINEDPHSFEGVDVSGRGSVTVDSRQELISPVFSGRIRLTIEAYAAVRNATGHLEQLNLKDQGVLQGSPETGIEVRSVGVANGRLQDISPFGITSPDQVDKLANARLLTIWMPRRFKRARKKADSMKLDPHQSLDFFQRLVDVIEQNTSSANGLSKARYLRSRSRRRALGSWDREWVALSLHRLVSFGESVLAPLLWYVALAIIVASGLVGLWDTAFADASGAPASLSFVDTWFEVVVSPATFFRFGGDVVTPTSHGPAALLLAFRIIGVVLLFLSLSAVRHLAAGSRARG